MSDTVKIARYYVASENEMGGSFPGVPLRDLSQAEYDALPEWIQRSIDASSMYRKTKPPTETAPLKAAPKAEKD